jgi:hypothetical protein
MHAATIAACLYETRHNRQCQNKLRPPCNAMATTSLLPMPEPTTPTPTNTTNFATNTAITNTSTTVTTSATHSHTACIPPRSITFQHEPCSYGNAMTVGIQGHDHNLANISTLWRTLSAMTMKSGDTLAVADVNHSASPQPTMRRTRMLLH